VLVKMSCLGVLDKRLTWGELEILGGESTYGPNGRQLCEFEDIFYGGFGGIDGRRFDEGWAVGHYEEEDRNERFCVCVRACSCSAVAIASRAIRN
jgi:hypothetical protein